MADPLNRDEPSWIVAIPAVGWTARYSRPGRGGTHRAMYAPVIAWSDTGDPLVLNPKRRQLVRAGDDPTFVKVILTASIERSRERFAAAQAGRGDVAPADTDEDEVRPDEVDEDGTE